MTRPAPACLWVILFYNFYRRRLQRADPAVIRSAFKFRVGGTFIAPSAPSVPPCIAVAAGERRDRRSGGMRYSTTAASIFLIFMPDGRCSCSLSNNASNPLSLELGCCNNSLSKRGPSPERERERERERFSPRRGSSLGDDHRLRKIRCTTSDRGTMTI